MTKILAFNWKLNPQDKKLAEQLFSVYEKSVKAAKNSQVIVCPPFEFLFAFLDPRFLIRNSGVNLGSQDCFWDDLGSYTGEVSALGLKRAGAGYIILGHSERRFHLRETNRMVNKKVLHAIHSGLRPLLCLGEDVELHDQGLSAVKKFLKKQLRENLKDFTSLSNSEKNQLIVVYEPVWAISNNSGNIADKPVSVAEIIEFIKESLVTDYQIQFPKVLYGGSVNSKNLTSFLSFQMIDGFLIGRASLDKEEVRKIIALSEKRG